MTDMPPLPPPTPSIKLTLEGLASLLGLKVCSHGDLGFAFGSGPVLASHEAATITREVVANLRAIARESAAARDDARTRAREEGEAAESLRAQLGETSNMLAEVSEILHRAWPEHTSGDPVQLARMTTAAAARVAAAEVIAAAGKREAEERAASEISRMLGRIAELEYQLAETSAVLADVTEILHRAWPEHMSGDPVQLARMTTAAAARVAAAETIASAGKRARAREEGEAAVGCFVGGRLLDILSRPPVAELEYQLAETSAVLADVRERAKADELEIRQLTESLRVARSAESAKAEEVDTLLKMIDALAPGLPSCVEPHSDRLAHAQRKIAAEVAAIPRPAELEEIRKILGAVWPAMEISTREARPTDALELARAAAAEIARLTAPRGVDDSIEPVRVLSPIHEPPELRRGSAQASGLDLPVRLGVSLAPGRTVRIPTGVQVAIPEGLEGQVRPRSSAAARGLLIHLGTIDADYRGEIDVVVTNLSGEWAAIDKPIAQLVICPVARPPIEYVEKLDDTTRGEGGFGSSDVIASGGYTNGAMVVVGKETK